MLWNLAELMLLKLTGVKMARNTGHESRAGAVKERVQIKNPVTGRFVKIDTKTGRIVSHKKTPGPYKGVKRVSQKSGKSK
jgi:hypothetical protein